MERDFMGISKKYLEEHKNCDKKDLAVAGGSALQWPFSNKISSLQHLMSYKTSQDERSRKSTIENYTFSGFQPFASKTHFDSLHHSLQRSTSLDKPNAQQFSLYNPRTQITNEPVPMNSPFTEVHGSSNVLGKDTRAFLPRTFPKPTTSSQLTIFYAGSVCVFDDVPLEKVQEIMSMASKSSNVASNTIKQRPITSTPKLSVTTSLDEAKNTNQMHRFNSSLVSNPIAITSNLGVQSRSSSATTEDLSNPGKVNSSLSTLPSWTSNASAPIVQRGVPMARKASLARFLEKRKERVTNAVPYPCDNKSRDNNISGKCSSEDLAISSNTHESWCSIEPKKNNIDIKDYLSTRLEM